jgi:hypothetical protein
MPLMFWPKDDVLKALGKLTLAFAELAFYLNQCLLRLHLPKTEAEAKKITGAEFNIRAKDLKDTLNARGASLWQDASFKFKPPLEFKPTLTDLSSQRNLLAHGIAYLAIERQEGQLVGKLYKYSSRSRQRMSLDDPRPIDELTAKIEKAVDQAQFLALNLQIEEHERKSKTRP